MRASGNDITEIFGFSPDDSSDASLAYWKAEKCPFTNATCTKTNHDRSIVYGTCAVTVGRNPLTQGEVIVCPKRLYASNYQVLQDVAQSVWGVENKHFIVGGSLEDLRQKCSDKKDCIVAFGQGSGREIQVNSNGQLSMDWVLQRYTSLGSEPTTPEDFVGIEVQSIDITGNYRDNWNAYKSQRHGDFVNQIPSSGHGLNWANVHKRLIPQIIRKGNIYKKAERCKGFYFIAPEVVFKKFEEVIGHIEEKSGPDREHVSVLTYELSSVVQAGAHREIRKVREAHFSLDEIATAFITNTSPTVSVELDRILRSLL